MGTRGAYKTVVLRSTAVVCFMSAEFRYPQELLCAICAHVYYTSLPPSVPSLDPLIVNHDGIPTGLPSAMPPAYWPEPIARHTLANLCLTSRAWYAAAKPWLWTKYVSLSLLSTL